MEGVRVSGASAPKTMRLRYPGVCAGCGQSLPQREVAHYVRTSKTVRCLPCGPGVEEGHPAGGASDIPSPDLPPTPTAAPASTSVVAGAGAVELVQGELARGASCDDCGRRLKRGVEALFAPAGTAVLCLECVTLDTVHSVGVPGHGARKEHVKRQQRHQAKVRTAHPKLGKLILALSEDPSHVRAWQRGAVGEEEFGRRLDAIASTTLKVLHDRKVPRSSANIDHLAITTTGVWVLDGKRYKGKVQTRGHGLFSRGPADLYVAGRNQAKLVEAVKGRVETVRGLLEPFASVV